MAEKRLDIAIGFRYTGSGALRSAKEDLKAYQAELALAARTNAATNKDRVERAYEDAALGGSSAAAADLKMIEKTQAEFAKRRIVEDQATTRAAAKANFLADQTLDRSSTSAMREAADAGDAEARTKLALLATQKAYAAEVRALRAVIRDGNADMAKRVEATRLLQQLEERRAATLKKISDTAKEEASARQAALQREKASIASVQLNREHEDNAIDLVGDRAKRMLADAPQAPEIGQAGIPEGKKKRASWLKPEGIEQVGKAAALMAAGVAMARTAMSAADLAAAGHSNSLEKVSEAYEKAKDAQQQVAHMIPVLGPLVAQINQIGQGLGEKLFGNPTEMLDALKSEIELRDQSVSAVVRMQAASRALHESQQQNIFAAQELVRILGLPVYMREAATRASQGKQEITQIDADYNAGVKSRAQAVADQLKPFHDAEEKAKADLAVAKSKRARLDNAGVGPAADYARSRIADVDREVTAAQKRVDDATAAKAQITNESSRAEKTAKDDYEKLRGSKEAVHEAQAAEADRRRREERKRQITAGDAELTAVSLENQGKVDAAAMARLDARIKAEAQAYRDAGEEELAQQRERLGIEESMRLSQQQKKARDLTRQETDSALRASQIASLQPAIEKGDRDAVMKAKSIELAEKETVARKKLQEIIDSPTATKAQRDAAKAQQDGLHEITRAQREAFGKSQDQLRDKQVLDAKLASLNLSIDLNEEGAKQEKARLLVAQQYKETLDQISDALKRTDLSEEDRSELLRRQQATQNAKEKAVAAAGKEAGEASGPLPSGFKPTRLTASFADRAGDFYSKQQATSAEIAKNTQATAGAVANLAATFASWLKQFRPPGPPGAGGWEVGPR